jgi:hypothetical protein
MCASGTAVLRHRRLCGACHLALRLETSHWRELRKTKSLKLGRRYRQRGRTRRVRRLHHLSRTRMDEGGIEPSQCGSWRVVRPVQLRFRALGWSWSRCVTQRDKGTQAEDGVSHRTQKRETLVVGRGCSLAMPCY